MGQRSNLYVDVHILQTVPPSCVNRDDTGSPKTAIYGGATRARVSSQCWKKAVRDSFRETISEDLLAVRTKKIVGLLAEEIDTLGGVADPVAAAQRALETAGLVIKSAEKGTDALFFISYAQTKALARLTKEFPEVLKDKASKEAKTRAQNALKEEPGLEIALFGRMVAADPSLNTDACAQVAHSISTHKATTEYDYFTAVDDKSSEDNAGAAHLATVEFNSSTLYRYATVAVHELEKHLKEDTAQAVSWFVDAFARSMPTGKQNTFANRTIPDALLVTLRTDQPVNLVGAFEKPVLAGYSQDKGYVQASAQALVDHAKRVYADWLDAPVKSFVTGELLSSLGDHQRFPELLASLKSTLEEALQGGGSSS